MTFKPIEKVGPTHWAMYMMVNDKTGMTEQDIVDADQFRDGQWPVSVEDGRPEWYNGIIQDCSTYTFLIKT